MALLLLVSTGCATRSSRYELELMPAPVVFTTGVLDPLRGARAEAIPPFAEILYATDRMPDDGSGGSTEQFYRHRRGYVLRLGLAHLHLRGGEHDEETVRDLFHARTENLSISITRVDEFGILGRSFWSIMDPSLAADGPERADNLFSTHLHEFFDRSGSRDVYVFVHGYRTGFEFPVLVAAELWHLLGYRGAFIGYSWPSRGTKLGYVADLDAADDSARNLRLFLEYLRKRTNAERIHLLAYSAGARTVLGALGQMALESAGSEPGARIGEVVLISSDFDRGRFGGLLEDGLLDVCERLTLYLSRRDKALDLSRRISGRERLGQAWVRREMNDMTRRFLLEEDRLVIVDATDAADATVENGHRYLRKSPWVSSDILMTLRFQSSPEKRGLVRQEGDPIWVFPPDYVERLQATAAAEREPGAGTSR